MAMTVLALVFIGTLATALSWAGLFGPLPQDGTNAAVSFAASVLWGVFGISAFDVIVHSTAYSSISEPIEPLAFMGIAFSLVVGLFSVKQLLAAVRGEVESTSEESIMP